MIFGIDITVLAFVGLVTLAVGGILFALLFNRVESERKQERRLSSLSSGKEDRSVRIQKEAKRADVAKRRQSVQKSLKELEESTKQKANKKAGIKDLIRQAGMTIDIKTFYIVSVIFGFIFAFVVFLASGNPLVGLAGLAIGTFGLPRWFISFKKKRRLAAFLAEFPNAVDVITRGIKAGLPLNDCLGIIAAEAKEPVKSEFQKVLEAQKLGIPMTEAIGKLYKNVPVTETNFFAIVIAIQQSAGGNLSEALANLAAVLRDRKKLAAKVKAMSAEAKASAGIIGSLPIIVGVLVYITTPSYISVLFTTETGNLIILGSLVWMGVGIMVMRQMINFDF